MGNTLGRRISRPRPLKRSNKDREPPQGQDIENPPALPDDDEPRPRHRMPRRQSREPKKRPAKDKSFCGSPSSGVDQNASGPLQTSSGSKGELVGNTNPRGKDQTQSLGGSTANPLSSTSSGTSTRYGRPDQLGLHRKEFINVHRKDYTGRIELLQGSVEGLAKSDETDLLIVYLSQRGKYKANRDSSLAALNRSGISLADLEKESKPQPSYRRHYHCWLSGPLPKPRPLGFEYKRLLIYEDPGEELTRDDNIVLDIVKCLTTVIGGDVQIQSVMIPLSGALLSPALRKHFVKAVVEVGFAWMRMGLPLRTVKILLPDGDITKDVETFRKTRDKLVAASVAPPVQQSATHDVFFSYAQADKEAAHDMIDYLKSQNSNIRIYDAVSRDISVRKRGVVDNEIMDAVSDSRIFLSLLSDDYFHSVECTEAFSLAYCRDFESQGNFIIPLFWRSCDLTPLARRLVATEGVDCREASFDRARMLLEEILSALGSMGNTDRSREGGDDLLEVLAGGSGPGGPDDDRRLRIADKLLMKRENQDNDDMFDPLEPGVDPEETVSQMFFDRRGGIHGLWSSEISSLVLALELVGLEKSTNANITTRWSPSRLYRRWKTMTPML